MSQLQIHALSKRLFLADVEEIGEYTVRIFGSEVFVDNYPRKHMLVLSEITRISLDSKVEKESDLTPKNLELIKQWK